MEIRQPQSTALVFHFKSLHVRLVIFLPSSGYRPATVFLPSRLCYGKFGVSIVNITAATSSPPSVTFHSLFCHLQVRRNVDPWSEAVRVKAMSPVGAFPTYVLPNLFSVSLLQSCESPFLPRIPASPSLLMQYRSSPARLRAALREETVVEMCWHHLWSSSHGWAKERWGRGLGGCREGIRQTNTQAAALPRFYTHTIHSLKQTYAQYSEKEWDLKHTAS